MIDKRAGDSRVVPRRGTVRKGPTFARGPRTLLWVSGALELTRNRFARLASVCRLAKSRIDPQPIVHLSSPAIRVAELVSFPTYPGAAGHSADDGGTREWGTLTSSWTRSSILGQFTISPRDRRFRGWASSGMSSSASETLRGRVHQGVISGRTPALLRR